MLRLLLLLLFSAGPLLADDLTGTWYGHDPVEGQITLQLNEDGTFWQSAVPSRASSDAFLDSMVQVLVPYTLADLVQAGLRRVVIAEMRLSGTYSTGGGTIYFEHPGGFVSNISGHNLYLWEFIAFLSAAILAIDGLDLDDEAKDFLIFMADASMVRAVLSEVSDWDRTVMSYTLDEDTLRMVDTYGDVLDLQRLSPTGVAGTSWGRVKSLNSAMHAIGE